VQVAVKYATDPIQISLLRDATALAPGGSSVARYHLDLDRSRDVDLRRELPATANVRSWPSICWWRRTSATASVRALGTLVAISLAGLTSPPWSLGRQRIHSNEHVTILMGPRVRSLSMPIIVRYK
jgi:hypothetical protein